MPKNEQRRGAAAVSVALATALGATVAASSGARAGDPFRAPHDVLYVESNSTVPGKNAVLAYRRAADGSLTPLKGSPFLTGGTGWFDPTYAVGPFDGDGIMAVDPINNVLYVPNGGSKSVAALRIAPSGALTPVAGSPFAVHGNTPNSLALRDRTLVVVDNGSDPNQAGQGSAGYETARITSSGGLVVQSAGAVARPSNVLPTQALAEAGSPFVLTNEFFGGTVSSYFLDVRGVLHLIERQAPPQESGETQQPLPLGLAVNPTAPFAYVALANVGRLAVYRRHDAGTLTFLRSVAVSGAAPCWIYVSENGKFVYVVNTVSNSVSVLDASRPVRPVEIQHFLLRAPGGFSYQIAPSSDGRFLYVLEEEGTPAAAGKSNQVHALAVDRVTGLLTEIDASPVKLPVPAGNRPQGLVVF